MVVSNIFCIFVKRIKLSTYMATKPNNKENEENEEWNEEVNQIQAAQPTLPQQPPSEQQISRPPPPAS